MWAGGPPKPMQPMRPHSRTMVESGTRISAGSVMVAIWWIRQVSLAGYRRSA